MTAQIAEIVIYKEKKYYMATEPLNDYLETRKDIRFDMPHTACWRGYRGKWKIKHKKLYLIELIGMLEDKPQKDPFVDIMEAVFPGQKDVFAKWFSGELRIPIEKNHDYSYMDYSSAFGTNIILEFKSGVLISEKQAKKAPWKSQI